MNDLAGLKALVVEDEGSIALMIEDMLADLGCAVAGTAGNLNYARGLAGTLAVDLAILDVNLAGEYVFPVARLLGERRIPFVFSTGYGARALPAEFSGYPVLAKPFSPEDLRRAIVQALTSARSGRLTR